MCVCFRSVVCVSYKFYVFNTVVCILCEAYYLWWRGWCDLRGGVHGRERKAKPNLKKYHGEFPLRVIQGGLQKTLVDGGCLGVYTTPLRHKTGHHFASVQWSIGYKRPLRVCRSQTGGMLWWGRVCHWRGFRRVVVRQVYPSLLWYEAYRYIPCGDAFCHVPRRVCREMIMWWRLYNLPVKTFDSSFPVLRQ